MLIKVLVQLFTRAFNEYSRRGKIAVLLLITCYIAMGMLVFRMITHYSTADALYFTIVTISTVGYGDLSPGPDHPAMQVFTVLYILVGVALVFPQLASLMTRLLELFRQAVLRLIDRFDSVESGISGRSEGISGAAVDVSGE
jgi:uncharacterized membrane protein YhaH (DUF805 family)